MPTSPKDLSFRFAYIIIPYLILAILIGLSWLIITTPALRLKNLICESYPDQSCSPALKNYFAPYLNQSLLSLDPTSILNQAPIFPDGERIELLGLKYPSTLILTTSIPQPDLALTRLDSGQTLVLSADKRVIAVLIEPPPNLPRIYVSSLPSVSINDQLQDPVLTDVHFLITLMSSIGLSVKTVVIDRLPTLAVYLDNGPLVLFTRLSNLKLAVASLQLILASPTINPEEIGEIDLRFGKPILKPLK